MARFQLPLAQVMTSIGEVGAGYKLHFYESGTSTPLDTYSDSGNTTPNANPVVADASGTWDDIYLANVPYKVVLRDADDVLIWTADPVQTPVGEIGIPVPVNKGGTGSTTASAARTALGLGTAATYAVGTGSDQLPTNSMVTGVPTGCIMLWYSSSGSIPSGWALCNGAVYSKVDGSGNITSPDLRDRFIVGATSTYAVGATGGATSGTTSSSGAASAVATSASGDHNHSGSTDGHTLSTSQIPSHSHVQNTGQGSGGSDTGWNVVSNATPASTTLSTATTGGGSSHSHGIQSSGTHTHTVDISNHTHTVATVPPYYALCYILKL